MMNIRYALLLLLILALPSDAAPKSVTLTYQLFRNDKPLGQVTETYQQQGNQYKIVSVTEGAGLMALAGKRVLISQGLVTADGLQPVRFEMRQGDNERKSVTSDFDWANGEITIRVKGNVYTQSLPKGTLDLASYPYQWMFSPPNSEDISVLLNNGKKLREYRYRMVEQDVILLLNNQSYQTVTLTNAGLTDSAEEKIISLSRQHGYLPVRILIRDENGSVTEQVISNIRIEY